MVCHHRDKSCDHKHCVKVLFELTGGSPPQRVTMFGGHWSTVGGDIKYLIFNVDSQKVGALHGMSPPCLVAISICVVEIQCFLVCHVIKQDHVIKGLGDYNDSSPSS